MKQYGILDDQGELFGLRGTIYTSLEAAEQALAFLRSHRREMEFAAAAAQAELAKTSGWDNFTAGRKADLDEVVATWEREKRRTFAIRMREVSPWVPVA